MNDKYANWVRRELNNHGHLHLHLDSGAEFGVSAGDVDVKKNGVVVVDSKTEHKKFPAEKVEWIDIEPSGLESGA